MVELFKLLQSLPFGTNYFLFLFRVLKFGYMEIFAETLNQAPCSYKQNVYCINVQFCRLCLIKKLTEISNIRKVCKPLFNLEIFLKLKKIRLNYHIYSLKIHTKKKSTMLDVIKGIKHNVLCCIYRLFTVFQRICILRNFLGRRVLYW